MADPRYKFLWQKVADNLLFNDSNGVEDWASKLSGEDMNKINKFLSTHDEVPALFFYVTSREPLEMTVSDDPSEYPGKSCILIPYFLKIEKENKQSISNTNIDQLVAAGIIAGDPISSFNSMFSKSYSSVIRAALDSADDSVDKKQLNIILTSIERKSQSISSTVSATEKAVILEPPADMHGVTLDSQSLLQASHDDNITNKFAQKMQQWCEQIQGLLNVTEQVRQEDEDSGPRAEMDYWRERLSIFSSLVESIKSNDIRIVVSVLKIKRPPILNLWNELDAKITASANEAKDNVKYLTSLEKYTELLYALDPPECGELVPGLITSVSMVHNISRYYRSPQRICTLLKKVTNQMINTCVHYICPSGQLYEQDRTQLIKKFHECIDLNKRYQECYNNTMKTKVPSLDTTQPMSKSGDLNKTSKSEKKDDSNTTRELRTHFIIFGKFDAFSERCEYLINLFTTIDEFNLLSKCRLEGMQPIVHRFVEDIDFTKRVSYKMLDPRNQNFQKDYKLFHTNCTQLDTQIRQIISDAFQVTPTPMAALELYNELSGTMTRQQGRAELEKWFTKTLSRYSEDLDLVDKEQQQLASQFNNKKLQIKNMPPIAGCIARVRQLMDRITCPMEVFKKHEGIFEKSENKKLIAKYNPTLYKLADLEKKCYELFQDNAALLKKEMQNTLIKMDSNHVLTVNFSHDVLRIFQEANVFCRFKFDLPPQFESFVSQEAHIKRCRTELQNLLVRHDTILYQITETFPDLFRDAQMKLEAVIAPGGQTLTWSSLNIDNYIETLKQKISQIEDVLNKVNDIRTFSINKSLQEIADTPLCPQFKNHLTDPQHFIDEITHHAAEAVQRINARVQGIQSSVCEIINIISTVSDINPKKEDDDGKSEPKQLFQYNKEDNTMIVTSSLVWTMFKTYEDITFRAVVKCFKNSMNDICDALHASKETDPTLFATELRPEVPNLVLSPDIQGIQKTLDEGVRSILRATQEIQTFVLARFPSAPEQQKTEKHTEEKDHDVDEDGEPAGLAVAQNQDFRAKNYFNALTRDYPTIALIISMTNKMKEFIPRINDYISGFNEYSFLWESDGDKSFSEFEATNPSIRQIKEKMDNFMELESKIEDIVEKTRVGPIVIDCGGVKNALIAEAKKWKQKYGDLLNKIGRSKMLDLNDFIEKMKNALSKSINQLDDLRSTMDALKAVREKSAEYDQLMAPIEESYSLLGKNGITIPQEELDMFDNIQYNWGKLRALEQQQQETLQKVSPQFKNQVIEGMAQFLEDFKQFQIQYNQEGPMAPGLTPAEASEKLKIFQHQFDNIQKRWITYSGGQDLFGLEKTKLDSIDVLAKQLKNLTTLYNLYSEVNTYTRQIRDFLWVEVKFGDIEVKMTEFQTRTRHLPAEMKSWDAYKDLCTKIDNFVETMPLLEALSNPAVKPVHWDEIKKLTKVDIDTDKDVFRLGHVFDAGLLNFKEDVQDICNAATQEAKIEAKLREIEGDWQATEFTFSPYKGMQDMLLKGAETNEIITKIEDSLMALSSLNSNRFVARFKSQVESWMKKLSVSRDVITEWQQVQSMWIYLEAVFSGGDIAKYMTQETKAFAQINKNWMTIMKNASDVKNVVTVCFVDEGLAKLFKHLLEQLQKCQKALSGYIEKKRQSFPRFYFLSEPVILEILGQASDPQAIQPHIHSIFDNLTKLEFDQLQYNKILGFESGEGEKVKLYQPFLAQDNVEKWLNDLINKMRQTLLNICTEMSTQIQTFTVEQWVNADFPAQIMLLAMMIWWTERTEDTLKRANGKNQKIFKETKDEFEMRFKKLVEIAGGLDKSKKLKSVHIEVLITLFLHNRDIYNSLVDMKIKSPLDFEWQKQMRYYWKPEGRKCIIAITDVEREYSYEYLGCTGRLVITPLTDRCYITLAQALGLSMGGAPAGPAGTGKTETVKDMAKALGIMCVVFNCSDQMNNQGLGRIFRGLAQAGCWGDFDEFNRIELDVLSVAAQQVATIFNACRERQRIFKFVDGNMVELDNRVAIFITMNPGYAGRQELPENLKIQFRMVAMMVPDKRLIMKVKLASSGFQDYMSLSDKFALLYALCSEQLSKQIHYDWGLRNILSVLRFSKEVRANNPTMNEQELLNRVLMNMNLAKLVDDDEPLFLDLLQDVFDKKPDQQPDMAIKNSIIENSVAHNLDPFPEWLAKAMQLQETCEVRHGIMILGPSGSGKSSLLKMLILAYSEVRCPHEFVRMNPKAITSSQMFGTLDPSSNDWTDGIFSSLWRMACKKTNKNVWLGLDGPVDAIWIENLNSVLDDNKTLTLANGDRLPMAPTVKLLFEMSSLDNASPATVSRAGMIYVPSHILTWRPLAMSWSKREDFKAIERIFPELISSFDKLFTYVFKHLKMVMKTSQVHIITTILHIFESMITSRESDGFIKLNCQDPVILKKLMIFSAMWAFGGFLDLDGRSQLSQWLCKEYAASIPSSIDKSQLFDYVVDLKSGGEWVNWETRLRNYEYPKKETPEFASILVPTINNTQIEYLLQLLAQSGCSILLFGDSGTAKTATINTFLNTFDKERWVSKVFNFSSATTPYLFQTSIESVLEKTIGTSYGPIGGKRMEVFIDDISMPEINEWGDQVTNEIVRQLMEDSGFYSLEKPGEFITVINTQFVAAMCTPGGGRNDVPDRLKRHFSIFNYTLPDYASINRIYSTILKGFFIEERGFSAAVQNLAGIAVEATHSIWSSTKQRMLPTPAKFHYVFNLRDLSRVTQGMLQVTSKEITSPELFVSLWAHECFRVFPDKFTTDQDKAWFADAIVKVGCEKFGDSYEHLLHEASTRLWCSFMHDPDYSAYEGVDDSKIPRIYEQVSTFDALNKRCREFMDEFNSKPSTKGKKLDLVLFDDAMNHLVRIARIIGMPRGHALLVGVGGSGKQSLTRLASTILGYNIFQVTPGRNYGTNDFLTDIRELYRQAGVLNKRTTFIFTDNEVKQESFLEFINNILTTGEIANLFYRDTYEALMSEMRPIFIKECRGQVDTDQNVYAYFINRVRSNLHIVLCFSPVGEQFRRRNLKFPGLFSGCTIDWFTHWPHQGLYSVVENFLKPIDIIAKDSDIKERLSETFALIHESVEQGCEDYFNRFRRRTFVTPKSYLSFLSSFKTLYQTQLAKIQDDANRMKEGLQKIEDAKVSVANMKSKLSEEKAVVAQKSAEAQQILDVVTVKRAEAEAQAAEVQTQKDAQEVEKNKIAVMQEDANAKLQDAMPAKIEAEKALQSLTSGDMNELKGYAQIGAAIMLVFDAVCILLYDRILPYTPEELSTKDGTFQFMTPSLDYGNNHRKSTTLLQTLVNYPKDQINDEQIDLLQPYLTCPIFNPTVAKKASTAAGGICSWVINVCKYHAVEKGVRPLKLQLDQATASLNKAEAALQVLEDALAEKQRALDELQRNYDAALGKQNECTMRAQATEKKLKDAQTLIDALSNEKSRWETQASMLQESILKTVGNATIGAAFNSYCGMFNHSMRQHFLNEAWPNILASNQIPSQGQIDIISLFVNEATLDTWQLQGLPSDELSRQNGVISTNAPTYPLLIDPQGQAHSWIMNRHKADLIITSFEDKYFRTHLENALQSGRPLLIEDCGEEIDPILDNILAKNYMKVGRSTNVSVGGKDVEIYPGFTLYFTTKLANPKFSPETFAKCSVIEFSVTQNGLQEQLLNLVILREKESLEIDRQRLLAKVAALKASLIDLENKLLDLLRSSKGDLLENTSLITTLNSTKVTSKENTESLNEAMTTNQKIENSRKEYMPVALRGAVIYFLIQDLANVNYMYQISLNQFLGKFFQAIEEAAPDPMTQTRIANIIQTLTYLCFTYIVRGLYEKDKLLFTLQLALKIQLSLNVFDFNDYQIFLKGGAAFSGGDKMGDITLPDIFSSVRENVLALSQISLFKGHFTEITDQVPKWKELMESQAPENMEPPHICENMTPFHNAVIIRCIRPDRAIFAANKYIGEVLGKEFLEFTMPSLDIISAEAGNQSPVIYLLSAGSDPTPLVEEAAKKAKIPISSISMGQGREEIAEAAIQNAKHKGEWVLLQNCHLGLKYMAALFEMYKADIAAAANAAEKKEEAKDAPAGAPGKEGEQKKPEGKDKAKTVHPDYRLWITTEPNPRFPVNLLQLSLKLTNEPPAGAKANLKRTILSLNQQTIEQLEVSEWRRLIYVLAFFNTTVQERRKFGPLGWCIPYEFNHSDFTASLAFCSAQIVDAQRVSPNPNTNPNVFQQSFWQTVRYGICEIHYGGRVTDELDRRLINAIGEHYFNNERVFDNVPGANKFFDISPTDNPANGKYPILDCINVNQFLEGIKNLPQNDPPEVFGLNAIADVKLRRDQADEIFQKIIDIQPKESAVGGMTREDVVMKRCQELLPQVPENFNMEQVRKTVVDNGSKPLYVCAKQEIERMQNVLKVLRSTLTDLCAAIDGTIVMNDQLYGAMNSLFDGRIPRHWLRISWPADTLKGWFDEVKARYQQYNTWINQGTKMDTFWLGGMFNPGGFVTSLRQETVRANAGWQLDQTSLDSEVQPLGGRSTKGDSDKPTNGPTIISVYCRGFWLEGARWIKTVGANSTTTYGLAELVSVTGKGKSQKLVTDLRNEMPLIKLGTSQRDPKAKPPPIIPLSKDRTYMAPIYKSSQRTDLNYIISIPLQTADPKLNALHWVLRGVCLTTK